MNPRVLSAFVLLMFGTSLASALVPGTILVAKASGDVYYQKSPEAERETLMPGYKLTENSVVTTGISSKAVLLFSSGSTLLIKPESQVHIEQYLATEAANAKPGKVDAESKTQLRLLEGDIVGSVRRLDQASTFKINALSYAAGIRGTDWWMKLRIAQPYEMTKGARNPRQRGRFNTTALTKQIDWGFGVAEGSAVVYALGGAEVAVGNRTVLNVAGPLSTEQTIEGAVFEPGDMPEAQFEAITGVAETNKALFD